MGSEAPCGASERLQRAYRRTGSERVIKRKERVTRCAGQPAFSVARTVYSSVRAGLVSGERHRVEWAQLNPWVVFGPRGCCREGSYTPVRPTESETRHWTPSRYMYASGMSVASVLLS